MRTIKFMLLALITFILLRPQKCKTVNTISPKSCASQPVKLTDDNFRAVLAYFRACRDLGYYLSNKQDYMRALALRLRRAKDSFVNTTSLPDDKVRAVVRDVNKLYFDMIFQPEGYETMGNTDPWGMARYSEEGGTTMAEDENEASQKEVQCGRDSDDEGTESTPMPHLFLMCLCFAILFLALFDAILLYAISEKYTGINSQDDISNDEDE